jgi:integrase
MARLANIVPVSERSFDAARNLTRGDVSSNSDGLIVTFRHTKTIQFGERLLHIPLLRIPGSRLCPVSAYNRMIRLVPGRPKQALFLLPSPRGVLVLTKPQFISEFRASLSSAGVPHAADFRGHSFRRGAASWAFEIGVPGELIQLYGDWSSDAYKLYLEFSVDASYHLRINFVLLFYQSNSIGRCTV